MGKIAIKFWEVKFSGDWVLATTNPKNMFTYTPKPGTTETVNVTTQKGTQEFKVDSNGYVRMIGDVVHIDYI